MQIFQKLEFNRYTTLLQQHPIQVPPDVHLQIKIFIENADVHTILQ